MNSGAAEPLTPAVSDLLAIGAAGVRAAHAADLVAREVAAQHLCDHLATAARRFSVAVGKAAVEMDAGLRAACPLPWSAAVTVAHTRPDPEGLPCRLVGDHPYPGPRSETATKALTDLVRGWQLTAADAVVVGVSGGTSALICAPEPPLSVADIAEVTRRLLAAGVDVTRINALRRLISRVHGGGLAALLAPARCTGLVLADNVQIGMAAVGSGPTITDRSTAENLEPLLRAHLPDDLAHRIRHAVRARRTRAPFTTPTRNILIGDPDTAVQGARAAALARGYRTVRAGNAVQGDVAEVARRLAAQFREVSAAGTRSCLIAAGEVTVSVRGPGRGGRCQELAWRIAAQLPPTAGAAFAAVATDGQDYLPGVGGAWVDGTTMQRARAAGIDWSDVLARSDSHEPLFRLGQLIPGGPTGTNVCDLYLFCNR
jgi:hydroxypyruvate reductase